ncbi:FG-GAP repeat domain-containing protein, partial [Streptomyces sp. NPDC058953]|uniref:FG-GAP repeat domain-containing protein n=1 Tax=Streptomyces sp. NPDC058953 TaxID=3346676 RepID=UPI00369D80E6
MAKTAFNRTGALSRVTVAALTAALVATGTSAVAADNPGTTKNTSSTAATAASEIAKSIKKQQQKKGVSGRSTAKSGAAAEFRVLQGLSGGDLYGYIPNGSGGYEAREFWDFDLQWLKNAVQADNDGDGLADDVWSWDTSGGMGYSSGENPEGVYIGGGWNTFNKVMSPGNLGGAAGADLLARDGSGNLWLYLGYGNGKVAPKAKVGSGWNIYNHIAGVGDLTDDGKADIVTVDKSGVLWVHPGSGDYKKPFNARVKVGGGWNAFNYLVGVGDLDMDGRSDLIARDKAGALFRYSGTGTASKPFKPMANIGTSGWNTYR